jgi:large subunit ribosomal protein L3
MGGRYGNERVTARNLKVVRVDLENNLLLVRGAVPGPAGGMVVVRPTNVVR